MNRNYVVFIRTDDMKVTTLVKSAASVQAAIDAALVRLHISDVSLIRELRANDTPANALGKEN